MAKRPSAKEFAQALPLLCAPELGVTRDMKILYEFLPCPSNMIEIVPIVRTFCSPFCDPISNYIEYYAGQFMESQERVLEFVIPRCMMLSDAPEPLVFILSCCFVVEVMFQLFDLLGCYRFVVTASICIRAIIERKFKSFFDDESQWQLLCSYCEKVMDSFYSEDEEPRIDNINLPKGKLKDYISNLINCNDTMDVKFVLSEYELSLLREDCTTELKLERNTKLIKTNKSFDELLEINNSVLDSVKNDRRLNVKSMQVLSEQSSELTDCDLDLSRKATTASVDMECTFESRNAESYKTQNIVSFPDAIAELISPEPINDTEMFTVNSSTESLVETSKTISKLRSEENSNLHGLCFAELHDNVCKVCKLKCFKYFVVCIENHRNEYGNDLAAAKAYVKLNSEQ